MWQRFTERARRVVFYAQEEAQKFGEGYVSTEHLLLGLIREPDTVAGRVLEKLGVSLNRIRAEVEKQLPRGDARPSQDMTLTPRAKRVIDLSYAEARDLGDDYIGTEHLLLGLIREGDGLAARVLQKLHVEADKVRDKLLDLREADTGHAPAVPRSEIQRTTAFLNGSYLGEHFLLATIADEESAASKLMRSQCEDIGALQWRLWLRIVDASEIRSHPPNNGVLTAILATAQEEAGDEIAQSPHLLLGILKVGSLPLRNLLESYGITYTKTKELIANK